MRIVRFAVDSQEYFGQAIGDKVYPVISEIKCQSSAEFRSAKISEQGYNLADVQILPPCIPEKILCLGLNYRDHAEEFKFDIPKFPIIFLKPASTVIAHEENIIYPNDLSRRVDYEGEFAIVIGAKCENLTENQVLSNLQHYVLGYTCSNDVTARDLQPKDGQWTIAKSFDTFLPLGPAIETDIDPSNLDIKTWLNGKLMQSSNTKNLIFDVPYIVSYLSNIMVLSPGDVIITGTSSGVGPMLAGDEIVIEIEQIGKLVNGIVLKYPERGYKPPKEKK